MIEVNTIYNEDCLKTMRRIDSETIHLIISDYPFNSQDGRMDYDEFVSDTAKEFFRILVHGGNLVVINNPPNMFRQSRYFDKFILRNKIALLRRGAFYPAWHYGYAHNEALLLSKGDVKLRWNGNVVNHQKTHKDFEEYQNGYRGSGGWHPQAIPEKLCQRWVEHLSNEGEIVYDPFIGSGTSAVCSKKMNRIFVGSEIKREYFHLANARIGTYQEELQLKGDRH